MFCTKCGKDVKEGIEVCPGCGAIIGSSQQAAEKDVTGLFGMLFDASFNKFLSARVVKFLYKLNIFLSIVVGIIVLILIHKGMWGTGWRFILAPIGGILTFAIWLILARLWSEIMIVLFKIAENVAAIAQRKE